MNKNEVTNQIQKYTNKNDILNIINEFSKNYKSYFEISTKNLINLITFYENLSTILETLPSKIDFPQIESNTMFKNNPSIKIINSFYNFHISLFRKLLVISSNIKKNIIPKLNIYKSNLENENSKFNIFISNTLQKINTQEIKISEANNNYKIESNKLKQLELDSIKKLNNTALLDLIQKSLDDQRKIVSNFSNIQQQEIQVINQQYSESQDAMMKKLFEIKSAYKNNNYIIFGCLKDYFKIFNDELFDLNKNEENKLIENIDFNEENQKPDEFIHNMLMNEDNKKIFFSKWKYEVKQNNENNNEDENIHQSKTIKKLSKLPLTDISYETEYMLIIKDNQIQDNYEHDSLSKFLIELRQNKEIPTSELTNIINLFDQKIGKIDFYLDFCDKYLNSNNKYGTNLYKASSLFEFLNFSNLAHFKIFLNKIIENISSNLSFKNKESFDLLDKIIIIGEKTFYDNTYLCSLLNQNKIFRIKCIWEDSIKFKILNILNEICDENIANNNQKNSGKNSSNNKRSKILESLLNKEQNNQSKKNNLLEYLCLSENLPNYNNLSEDNKIIINKIQAPTIIFEVFKAYIMHMSNYEFKLEDSINVIYNIYNYYQFKDNDIIRYFLTYNNIYYYSCKNKMENQILNKRKEKNKEKIKDIKNKNNFISQKCPTLFKNEKSKIIILKKIFVFLNNKERIQLIALNKKFKTIISNKLYKHILKQKNSSIEKHIEIWKIFLNSNKLKEMNKNIYENFMRELNSKETNEKYFKIFKIIEVDINRTGFILDKPNSSIAASNILKSLHLYNLDTNYYQGMNYMASYIYQNTLKEEESFYIMLGLFITKNFSSIFQNNLSKLKTYFSLMDKLIYLYLPKIHFHFKKNQIKTDFFLSPYFITLFTNIYSFIKEKDNIFIMRVWDEFIFNGWKIIFEVILTLLKLKEKILIKLEGDELIDYLVNKINKDDIFKNKNYEKFEEMKKYFVINNDLITYIEEEIKLGNKIQKKFNYQ